MDTPKSYYLAIDLGTQSVRTAVVDSLGNIVDIEKIDIEPYFSEQPSWAEQHPQYYWDQLCISSKTVLERQSALRDQISAVSLSCQRSGLVNLDDQGQPLRPAIIWLDDRKAKMKRLLPSPIEAVLKLVRVFPVIRNAYINSEWNWLSQNQPEIIAKTHKFLLLSGFLTHRLTAQYHESVGHCVAYLPFDYVNHQWLKPGSLKTLPFNIPLKMLPKLFKPGEVMGHITAEASAQTGIPEGLPFVAGSADKSAEVLGSGVTDNESVACLSLGTTATVQTVMRKYKEMDFLTPPYPSAIANMYNSEVIIFKGFWMVSWFRDEFSHLEKELAKVKNVSPELLLNDFLTDVPAGSLGLITQPYWGAGVGYPGIEAKGSMIGFGDVHTRPYVYKSIIEGLAYALKSGLNHTERKLGKKVKVLRLAGGGSQSDNIMQIMADVFNRPAERPHTYEASILGVAIIMAVSLGHYKSYDEAVQHMVRIGARFEPNPENVKIYAKLYKHVYRKMYRRLKPIYKSIQKITGYPKI